jgi:transcriptional regulator with XRE-family HTH domain
METNETNEQHWRELVLHLSRIAEEKGITHQAIADELGMQRSNVSRFFAGNQCPTLRTFCAIARAVTEYEPTCC